MKNSLVEISVGQVSGVNRSVIEMMNSWNPKNKENHFLRDLNGLDSCLNGIFYQTHEQGYINLPIEKMAGLLLYRIAQGQYFENGNKRTALVSTRVFLKNNGHDIKYTKKQMSDLLWGVAVPPGKPRYNETDSIKFCEKNIFVI